MSSLLLSARYRTALNGPCVFSDLRQVLNKLSGCGGGGGHLAAHHHLVVGSLIFGEINFSSLLRTFGECSTIHSPPAVLL